MQIQPRNINMLSKNADNLQDQKMNFFVKFFSSEIYCPYGQTQLAKNLICQEKITRRTTEARGYKFELFQSIL